MAGRLEGVGNHRRQHLANGVFVVAHLIIFAVFMNILTTSHAQTGFLSIDCGSTQAKYTDNLGLEWVTDNGQYINTGISVKQSFVNVTSVNSSTGGTNQALQSFRHFPQHQSKYCYELPTAPIVSYLIRATFYMNVDELAQRPPFQFVAYINATEWFTIISGGGDGQSDLFITQEAIFYSPGQIMYFCLHPVGGLPFISSLELRELTPTMYSYTGSRLQFLDLLLRYNPGAGPLDVVRFPEDSYDRIWQVPNGRDCSAKNSSCVSSPLTPNTTTTAANNNVPPSVMQDAWLLPNDSIESFDFYLYFTPQVSVPVLVDALVAVYVKDLNLSDSRPYVINSALTTGDQSALGLDTTSGGAINVSHQATMQAIPNLLLSDSIIDITFSLPPDSNHSGGLPLNAFEAYAQYRFNFSSTNPGDADGIKNLTDSFSLTNWQGDPCTPVPHDWLSCQVEICALDSQSSPSFQCATQGAFLFSGYVVTTL
ncbi:unnamed protein product [Calypogeia fissa]